MRSAHRQVAVGALWILSAAGCMDAPQPDSADTEARVPDSEASPAQPVSGGSVERTGLYVYWADAARFTDCPTGESWPVAMEGASVELERAHLLHRSEVGEGTRMRVIGRVEPRPGMEPDTMEDHLVVDSLVEAGAATACPDARIDRSVTETRWSVEWLPGGAASPAMWLVLDDETRSFEGATGCRPLTGVFELMGTRLRFGSLLGSGPECAGAEGRADAAVLEALRVAGSFRLRGDTLELMDEAGVAARLVAR